jgi:FkbM family methyltransferase
VVCDGVTLRCDPHHVPFWNAFEQQAWEPATLSILRRFLNHESVYYDIGSWIGPTVVYAARLSRIVFAFEPDPLAYACLLANITNNGLTNVRAFNLAVAATPGVGMLNSFGGSLGDSMSSLLSQAQGTSGWPVTRVTVDTLVNDLSCASPDFVKIDIEGGEFDLVPAMRSHLERWKPVLHLSLHAPYLPVDEREEKLEAIARALDFYPIVLHQLDEWSNGGAATFRIGDLPTSAYRDDFGSLLFLPAPVA